MKDGYDCQLVKVISSSLNDEKINKQYNILNKLSNFGAKFWNLVAMPKKCEDKKGDHYFDFLTQVSLSKSTWLIW